MKEFIDKLIGRLEEEKVDIGGRTGFSKGINKSIEIVNQLAEEYKDINIITNFLQYVRDNADNYDADNGWSLSDLIDLSIKFCDAEEHNDGWIPCSEKQPSKDGYYLITTSDGEIDVREYDYGNGWGWDGFERIIAWQPIQPYKAEEAQWKRAMMNTFLKR